MILIALDLSTDQVSTKTFLPQVFYIGGHGNVNCEVKLTDTCEVSFPFSSLLSHCQFEHNQVSGLVDAKCN